MSIKTRVDRLAIAMIASIMMIVAVGLVTSVRLVSAQNRAQVAADALRNHLEADMMHDALRGDVYQALYANERGDLAEARAVTKEHNENRAWFREMMLKNEKLDLPLEIHRAFQKARPRLEAYVDRSDKLVVAATVKGSVNMQDRRNFDERFELLETELRKVSDTISAEVDSSRRDVQHLMTIWLTVLGLGSICLLFFTFYSVRTLRKAIVGPLSRLVTSLKKLTSGELDAHVSCTYRTDEIGELAKGVLGFREAVVSARQAEARAKEVEDLHQADAERRANEQAERDRAAAAQRKAELAAMAQSLEERVLATADLISKASQAMRTTSTALAAGAVQTRDAARAANDASERSAQDSQVVVIATTQMMSAIEEVSKLSATSAESARIMAEQSIGAGEKVRSLEDAAEKIGDVSRMIADIAAKTNMLALNATIEAARAGIEGQGFAVVANEVKLLAEQIGHAIGDISAQIEDVRDTAESVASAIGDMGQKISLFDQSSTAIATAIDEQGAAIADINRTVQGTVEGTEQLRLTMESLVGQADSTGESAATIVQAVHELERQGSELSAEVRSFIEQVRAA